MQGVLVSSIASYVLDWLLVAVAVVIFQRLGKLDGHRQRFSLNDISIQYTYGGPSTIPNWALVILSVILPAVVILSWTLSVERRRHRSALITHSILWTLNKSWLGLALSIALSQVVTNAFKITVGRPRPDLIARCIPRAGSVDAAVYGLSTSEICTQIDVGKLRDGFRSFPSGHSSMAFSGLAYLTFFLASRLHVFNNKGNTWKWVVVVLPILVASLVAISRIKDNRHHPFDVFFGSALGILTSLIAYYQYFPDFTSDSFANHPRFIVAGNTNIHHHHNTSGMASSRRVSLDSDESPTEEAENDSESLRLHA